MAEIYEYSDVEKEETFWEKTKRKTSEIGHKAWDGLCKAGRWCKQNKELAIGAALTVAEVGVYGFTAYTDAKKKEQEENDRECLIYDPHTGCRYFTRHPMRKWSRKKADEFHERISNGEDYYTVLISIGEL